MPSFEITAVSEKERPFDSKYGPKVGYRVHLRNGDGTDHLNVELVRNASSPKPALGEQLDGDLEDRGEYGERIRIANRGGAGGVWAGTAGSKEYKADPVKQAAIAMETAQKSAIAILSLAAEKADGYTLPETVGGVTEQVKMVAKMLYGQIAEVSEAAK